MKTRLFSSYGFLMLIVLTMILEGCAGCSHRSRKVRERHRDRVEQREGRRERHRGRDRDNDSRGDWEGDSYSEDYIENIAESDDYDAMLNCLTAQLNEIKKLKDEYFRGNLPDREAKERMQKIDCKYAPVEKALKKADDEGRLTYNQHKHQVKLMGDYLMLATSVANRLGSDLESLLGI